MDKQTRHKVYLSALAIVLIIMVTIAPRPIAVNSWHIAKVGTRSFNVCVLGSYYGIANY